MATAKQRVLVTGGGTFLGNYIAAALLAEGADVTLLVRTGAEERLGQLADRTRWHVADVWNPASLRGRARGQQSVIHTVGSMNSDPAQGPEPQLAEFCFRTQCRQYVRERWMFASGIDERRPCALGSQRVCPCQA